MSPYPCIFPKLFFPNHLDPSLILLLVPSLNIHSKSPNTLTAVQSPNALPLHPAIRLLPRGSTTHLSPKGAAESSSVDSPSTLGLMAPMGTDCPFLSVGSPSCLCASLPLLGDGPLMDPVMGGQPVTGAPNVLLGLPACYWGSHPPCHCASVFLCVCAGKLLSHNLMLLSWLIFSVTSYV